MAGDINVGNLVGYLRLDRSTWTEEIEKAKGQADELGRKNPKIKIDTNAPEAIGQLEAVAAAAKRLQDAQGKVAVSQRKLDELQSGTGGVASAVQSRKIADAQEALSRASRDVELSQIRLAKSYETVDAAQSSVTKSAQDANNNGFKPLLTTVALLGPAIVPLGAAAAGALGAAALAAGSLALAVKGAQAEIKSGSALGQAYAADIGALSQQLHLLEHTAAAATLKSFNTAVDEAGNLFPNLNAEVGRFAGISGDLAGHVLHGVIGGFLTLQPLLEQIAIDADHGAVAFDRYANGGGLAKFGTWVQANLPGIEQDIGSIGGAVGKITAAMGPMGVASLSALSIVARGLDALPIGALQVLLPLVTDTYLAFQSYKGINSVVDTIGNLTGSVKRFTAEASVAAPAAIALADAEKVAGLSFAASLGPVGAVVTGIGLLAATFFGGSGSTRQATQDINDYTEALRQDNGAIADNTRAQAAKKLVDSGAIDLASKLKIGTADVTSALVNGGAAAAELKSHLEAVVTAGSHLIAVGGGGRAGGGMAVVMNDDAKAATKLLDILKDQSGDLTTSIAKVNQLSATYAALGLNLDGTAKSLTNGTVDWVAYNTLQDAAQQSAASNTAQIAEATLALQREGNAAGLVNQALATMAGTNLSAAQAQTAVDAAVLSMTTTLKQNKGTLDEHTQAGVDDRQAIEGAVGALRSKLQVDAQATGSTEQATANYKKSSDALLETTGRLFGVKSAAYLYLQQLLKIPPIVKTKAELDAAQALLDLADFKLRLSQIPANKKVTISVAGVVDPASFVEVPGGGRKRLAAGGYVDGPGTSTSDSVPALLSRGEFVMPAGPTNRFRSILESMRIGSGGVMGPSSSSPAAASVRASYNTPAAPGGSVAGRAAVPPIVIYAQFDSVLDGRVISTTVREFDLRDGR